MVPNAQCRFVPSLRLLRGPTRRRGRGPRCEAARSSPLVDRRSQTLAECSRAACCVSRVARYVSGSARRDSRVSSERLKDSRLDPLLLQAPLAAHTAHLSSSTRGVPISRNARGSANQKTGIPDTGFNGDVILEWILTYTAAAAA